LPRVEAPPADDEWLRLLMPPRQLRRAASSLDVIELKYPDLKGTPLALLSGAPRGSGWSVRLTWLPTSGALSMTASHSRPPAKSGTDRLVDFDSQDEELELELGDEQHEVRGKNGTYPSLSRSIYFRELFRLQAELVKLQDWVVNNKLKILVIFEGRDAAGKGGVIKRITQRLNPRTCRVVALTAPTERERMQWYFQRYMTHLPTGGEIVIFDRSWYNRAGVERVMGFCTQAELEEFFRSVPELERMLVRSGIKLIKYWFSITDEEQHARFTSRIEDPLKQWKLSPMDLESRRRWEAYTKAKEEMLEHTHTPEAPWWIVEANDKRRARLNCIEHLLRQVPYDVVEHKEIVLPERVHNPDYIRGPIPPEMYVPNHYPED
jgi:polyphosphate kinase 2